MDRIPKDSPITNYDGEDSETLNKNKTLGVTRSGRDVKTSEEKKIIPVSQAHGENKSLSQRTKEPLSSNETLLQNSDITDSLVHAKEKQTIEHPAISNEQNKFQETLVLADLDTLMGFNDENTDNLKTAFKNFRNANSKIAMHENDPDKIEAALESRKAAADKILSILNKHKHTTGLVHLTNSLMQQIKQKGLPLNDISDDKFKKEINFLLEDMNSRGIGLSSKIRIIGSDKTREREQSKHKFYASPWSYSEVIEEHTIERLKRYSELFSQLPEFDEKFEEFINSEQCHKWDVNIPLYRGGDVSLERKMLRNVKKDKLHFRKDSINRGKVVSGFGQYYTSYGFYAGEYAKRTKTPVILTTTLKEGTPLVNRRDLMTYCGEEDQDQTDGKLNWKEYLENFRNNPIILAISVKSGDHNALAYTLNNSEVIDQVTMNAMGDLPDCDGDGPKSVTELSMHRLNEDSRIVGYPEEFECASILVNTELEDTEFVALGHSSGEQLAVKKYQIDATTNYCVEDPDNNKEYLLVKQLPESISDPMPTFIVEPSVDFLLQRKQQKLDNLQKEENRSNLEKQANENVEVVRDCFNIWIEHNKIH